MKIVIFFQKSATFNLVLNFNSMKKYIFLIFSVLSMSSNAQQMMTPEKLWQLGRVTPIGISKDGKSLIYKVGTPNIQENKIVSKYYSVPVGGGNPVALDKIDGLVADKSISPNGQEYISVQQVKVEKILGSIIAPSALLMNAFATFSLPKEMQQASPLVPALQSNWLMMHVTVMIISYATLIVGCLLSILLLILNTAY